MKKRFWTYIFPAALALIVAYGCRQASEQGLRICEHTYALCTSAPCVPVPGKPSQAVCFCDVQQGKSVSTTKCSSLEPSTDGKGIATVYSTFSFEQFRAGLKGMKSPDGTPWTWCLNKKCTVNPLNPDQAICICDVMRKGEWMTAGGKCDTGTCGSGYWSGATLDEVSQSEQFLVGEMGLKQSPIKWCPQ